MLECSGAEDLVINSAGSRNVAEVGLVLSERQRWWSSGVGSSSDKSEGRGIAYYIY